MALKRGLVVLLGVALQLLLVLLTYVYIAESYLVVKIIIETLGLILVLHLIRNSKSYSYILPWIIIILLFSTHKVLWHLGNIQKSLLMGSL